MSKGDAEHASQHAHGVQHRVEPAAPQTVEQRLAKLEEIIAALQPRVAKLEGPKELEEE